MNVTLITPAAKGSRSGNRVTAERWARLLRALGHRVRVAQGIDAHAPDLLIAIHAYRSAAAVAECRRRHPACPVIVLLAGTDVYRYQHSHPRETLATMAAAQRLVGLHADVGADIPAGFGARLRVIYQSASAPVRPRRPSARTFDVCVVGHLRDEKDPLRAALAARMLPAGSRLRVVHLGKAHTPRWAQRAHAQMAVNPRYQWRGEVAPAAVRRCFASSHAMVISSRMEGGANVVSEAIVAGLPVLASRIPGNLGLLGQAHPACFPTGDTRALAALLHRAETDPGFLPAVLAHQRTRAALFDPDRERAAWASLLAELA